MLDIRRFERGFLFALAVVAVLVGVTRLVLHLTTPELQFSLAAESAEGPADSPAGFARFEPGVSHAPGSVLLAFMPHPTSHVGVMPYYLGAGWGRAARGWPAAVSVHAAQSISDGAPDAPGPKAHDPAQSAGGPGRIDINSASSEQLQTLPGIGPALAERIIDMREHRGGFVYPDELLDVSGIGPARYEQIADRIVVVPLDP